ncbi:hypothetical protein TNCV_4511781 [Trichonephila clavipes]|nr:hypothetical protein TNCV_4511781 [Trichonephila clavipes]
MMDRSSGDGFGTNFQQQFGAYYHRKSPFLYNFLILNRRCESLMVRSTGCKMDVREPPSGISATMFDTSHEAMSYLSSDDLPINSH